MNTNFQKQKAQSQNCDWVYFLKGHFFRYAAPFFLSSPTAAKNVIPIPITAPIPATIAIFSFFIMYLFLIFVDELSLIPACGTHRKLHKIQSRFPLLGMGLQNYKFISY